MRTTIATVLTVAVGVALCATPAQGYLSYTLSSELKKANCSGDTDADCLDNSQESSLAWILAPQYFYDEDEGCSGWQNAFHYGRQDYYQVRPEGWNVGGWVADGTVKWVTVTYFLLHPHDCQNKFLGIGGHQGDSEHVRYWLYSYDLKTWNVYNGRYWHHGQSHDFSGSYLEARANEIGALYPSVAGDEDGHGSWAGRSGGSSHCAGSEDDFCLSTCDCFVGTMGSAFANGWWEWVGAWRNVGGPAPETWNGSVLTVSGSDAYSIVNVGHGSANREYWNAKSPSYQKFCGWECSSRKSDGSCNVSAHSESGCSSPLSEKVDSECFGIPSNGCCGSCGGYQGSCWCDSSCVIFNDCCADACAACGACPSQVQAIFAPEKTFAGRAPDPAIQAAEVVVEAVPGLAGQTPQQQLEALEWMLTAPQGKIVAALPDLATARGLPYEERSAEASLRVEWLIEALRRAGTRAADLPDGFVAAAKISAVPLSLTEIPAGMLQGYNPYPEDPWALDLGTGDR